jgi:hypothetical protein
MLQKVIDGNRSKMEKRKMKFDTLQELLNDLGLSLPHHEMGVVEYGGTRTMCLYDEFFGEYLWVTIRRDQEGKYYRVLR